MSRKSNTDRHLKPVPVEDKPEKPVAVGYPVTVELSTGGRFDVDTLLRELARHSFGPSLRGWHFEAKDGRPRAYVECTPLSTFGHEQIQDAAKRVTRALLALEIVKPAAGVKTVPSPEETKTEAAECPQPSSQES